MPPLIEERAAGLDGTGQADRALSALDPATVGLDTRSPAEMLALVRRLASRLLWVGPDNRPAGWWGTPPDGEPAGPAGAGDPPRGGPGLLDDVDDATAAAFLADPAAFAGLPLEPLRRPHIALLLTAIRLMRHGQQALNGIVGRHLDHQLRTILALAPRAAEPDRAHLLFALAPGVDIAEAPAGLRLLGGRDAAKRDRVYALDAPLTVTRARVARLASSFAERETVGLVEARRAIVGTPDEQMLFLLSLVYGAPGPADPPPPLAGTPFTAARLPAIGRFIAHARAGLHLELHELRAMLARKAARASDLRDWARVNGFLEAAGRRKRGDNGWQLAPPDPRDFPANLARALGGPPDLSGLPEVATVEDLVLHLGRADVREVISTRLFLMPERQFAPMMATKRAIETDWSVVNAFLETAGRRRRPDAPGWTLPPAPPHDFERNMVAAIGAFDAAAAGPEAAGVANPDQYLARIGEMERWFQMPAEDIARLVAALLSDETTMEGAARWRDARALLTAAHGRIVRARGAAAMAAVRAAQPNQRAGLETALELALGRRLPAEDVAEALTRHVSVADAALVAAALEGGTPDWARIDPILEEARRRRLRLPEPVPERRRWRALWAWPDAGAALAGATGESWQAFGGVPPATGPQTPPAPVGWALASPALRLSGGTRRLILTLWFHAGDGTPLLPPDAPAESAAARPFTLSLSTADGWFEPAAVAITALPGNAPGAPGDVPVSGLLFTLTLDETAPAIAPPADRSALSAASGWPVLRLLLRPVWNAEAGHWETAYDGFRNRRLARVQLAVMAGGQDLPATQGLFPLLVETDTGPANGKKPFEPFGPMPATGAELAIAHPDLAHKQLTSVALRLEWQGAPADITAWYTHYNGRTPAAFTAQLLLVDAVRTTALGTPAPLFAGNDGTLGVRIGRAVAAPADAVPEPGPPAARDWRRHLLLRLSGADFGHRSFPALATAKAIQLAADLKAGASITPANYTVNQPWTPKLKRLSLELAASHAIDLARYDPATAVDRLFHLEAFGEVEAQPSAAGWPMLPALGDEGTLYVGLEGVRAPQPLSLLFAGVEEGGSAERTGPVRWSWLGPDGWADFPLPPDDGTQGLMRRGIVHLELPAGADRPQPGRMAGSLPGGLSWIRLSMAEGARHAAPLLGVHAQAGLAVRLADPAAAPPEPVPAATIKAFGEPAPGIARVVQPYPSSAGRAAETDHDFRVRASEQLRHKGRAITPWDYERLVLAGFPDVHKVKCLPAGLAGDGPGVVRLILIPDLRHADRADPFAPRAPAKLLDAVADYLAPRMPAGARLVVGHPRFVPVRVRLGVRFRPGGDEAHDRRRLADRLNRFLAPWAFAEGADIAIGQRIDVVGIVAFVDSLSFVDFVGGCRLFISLDGGASFQPGAEGGAAAVADAEDAVLVPAARHEIDLIQDQLFEPAEFSGIGYMKVELDFVVG